MRPVPVARSPANDDTLGAIEEALWLAQRLRPDWHRPEQFHEQKSELIAKLRAIAAAPVLVRQTVRFIQVDKVVERVVEKIMIVPAPPARPRPRRRHRYPTPPAGPGGLL